MAFSKVVNRQIGYKQTEENLQLKPVKMGGENLKDIKFGIRNE